MSRRSPLMAAFVALIVNLGCPSNEAVEDNGRSRSDAGSARDAAGGFDGTADAGDGDAGREDGAVAPEDAAALTNAETLQALGVDLDLSPVRASAVTGEPINADAHPLTRDVASLGEIRELFVSGLHYDAQSTRRYFLANDLLGTPTDLVTDNSNHPWITVPGKRAAAADVDGDGFDEVAVVYLVQDANSMLYVRIIEDQTEHFAETNYPVLSGLGDLTGAGCLAFDCLRVAAGDIDGDGREELSVALSANYRLYLLGDETESFAKLHEVALDGPMSNDIIVRLYTEVADLDSDGFEEVVVTRGERPQNLTLTSHPLSTYHIYEADGPTLSLAASGTLASASTQLIATATVVAGDFDADGIDELAFAGAQNVSTAASLLIMEDGRGMTNGAEASAPYSFLPEDLSIHQNGPDLATSFGIPLGAGDFDGDRKAEIIAANSLVHFDEGEWSSDLLRQLLPPAMEGIVTGDFDETNTDGREDFAYIGADGPNGYLVVYGAPPDTGFTLVERARYAIDDPADTLSYPVLAAPNVDFDSYVVRYQGIHEVVYSDPIVIAVLASPPFHLGVEHASGGTVLGDSSTTGFNASHAIGGKFGFSFGAHADSPLWGSAGSFDYRFKPYIAVDFLWEGGSEMTYSSSIENPTGHDLVIFTAVPYDCYAYEVLSSPHADEIGEVFTLNIPRHAQVHHLEREYYNAHNGTARDIDASILTHTLGFPHTYPTAAERDAIVAGSAFLLQSASTQSCSGGGAVSQLGVEWSQSVGAGLSVEVGMEYEAENVASGFAFGLFGDVHFGVELTWSWSNATFVQGSVGDVMPEGWAPDLGFEWGVFAYQHVVSQQAPSFTVVTYWVE